MSTTRKLTKEEFKQKLQQDLELHRQKETEKLTHDRVYRGYYSYRKANRNSIMRGYYADKGKSKKHWVAMGSKWYIL